MKNTLHRGACILALFLTFSAAAYMMPVSAASAAKADHAKGKTAVSTEQEGALIQRNAEKTSSKKSAKKTTKKSKKKS